MHTALLCIPQTTKHIKKEGRETTLPLVVLAENRTPEREREKRENKKILRKEKGWRKEAEDVCKDMKREKEKRRLNFRARDTEELERGSLVWQRRGLCLNRIGSC